MNLFQVFVNAVKLGIVKKLCSRKAVKHCAERLSVRGKLMSAKIESDSVFHINGKISASRAAPAEVNVARITHRATNAETVAVSTL